jgi:hypothetical protein
VEALAAAVALTILPAAFSASRRMVRNQRSGIAGVIADELGFGILRQGCASGCT